MLSTVGDKYVYLEILQNSQYIQTDYLPGGAS